MRVKPAKPTVSVGSLPANSRDTFELDDHDAGALNNAQTFLSEGCWRGFLLDSRIYHLGVSRNNTFREPSSYFDQRHRLLPSSHPHPAAQAYFASAFADSTIAEAWITSLINYRCILTGIIE
jgi:hypothetical protein